MPITVTLDDSTWWWLQISLWVTIALVIAIIVIIVYHLWEEHRYPREAKQIKQAALKNKPLIDMAGDDGYEDFVVGSEFIHEGILETKPLTKSSEPWVGFLPRQTEIDKIEVASGKDAEKTMQVLAWLAKMSSRKLYLRGAKVPVWHAYRGKTVAISLLGLVAIEMLEELAKAFPSIFASVDQLAIKNYFDLPWDQTQRSAQGQRRENVGFKKGLKWNKQEGLKTVAFMFIVGGVLLVFAVIILKML